MPSFAVIVDEDLPARAAQVLTAKGYRATTVGGQGWGGISDTDLWPLIQKASAFFITADKGFADIRMYPAGTHQGVLLLRPDREGIVQYISLLEEVLAQHPLEQLKGAIVVATARSIRIRRPPVE